jgi:hypothetical protein
VISQLPTAPTTRGLAGALAREPIRVAWVVIWVSLAAFLILVSAAVVASAHYVATAVRPASATLVSTSGTVLAQKPIWPRPFAAQPGQALSSGDTIQTDTNSNATATLQFSDGSTVLLEPGTELQLTKLRSNRYTVLSGRRREIDLALRSGKLEAVVTKYADNGSRFAVTSLGNVITITDGTTDVWLSQPRTGAPVPGSTPASAPFTNSCCATQVLTQNGSAAIVAPGGNAALLGNQRATIPMGGAPFMAPHANWDLLVNPSLLPGKNGYPDVWNSPSNSPSFDITNGTPADHFAMIAGATPMVHLWSANSEQHHESISFRQEIDRDVRDFLNLDLQVSFKINSQSLSGGGYDGTEYPFRVAVDFFDAKGSEQIWFQGFYIKPPTGNSTVRAARQVTAGQWFPQQAGEGDMRLSTLPDPPVYIKWVEFSASGHDFDTDVREVRLLAQ